MDRGGTTPLFLHATSLPPKHALTKGTPLATPSSTGKAETCLRIPWTHFAALDKASRTIDGVNTSGSTCGGN
jgi:hypothetical protein